MTDELSSDQERTEAAYQLLGAEPELVGYRHCPGCDRLIHHTNLVGHARSCGELRGAATPEPASLAALPASSIHDTLEHAQSCAPLLTRISETAL
jgi:hypothetical protein